MDKETGVQTFILEWKKKNDSVFLCLGTDRLYYVENAETVYSVDYFGGEKTEITSIKRLEEAQAGVQYLRSFIYGMSVQNGSLYFTTEIGRFISDEDGKHVKFLTDRSKTSCFWKEYLICQNEVSEVYSYNLVSGEERTSVVSESR